MVITNNKTSGLIDWFPAKPTKITSSLRLLELTTSALTTLGWKTLNVRRKLHISIFVSERLNNISDCNFNHASSTWHAVLLYSYNTHSNSTLPNYTNNWGQSRSDFLFVKEYNSLPDTVKNSKSLAAFIRNVFPHYHSFFN